MTTSLLLAGKLSSSLQACSQGQLQKGRLDVKDPKGLQWSLYFDLGHLVGEAGGVHPVRRWYRQLSRYCPQLGVDQLSILGGKIDQSGNYEF